MKAHHFICLGLLITASISAKQNVYEHSLSLQLSGEKAAYAFDVPDSVYQNVYHSNLSDVRVINAKGDFVPMRLLLNSDQIEHEYSQTSLPTFNLNKTTSVPINTKQKRTTKSGNNEDYTLETSESMRYFIESHENVDNSTIYIDASSLKEQNIEQLSLDWQFENQGNRVFYVRLLGSNDLTSWQTIKSRHKLLEIKSGHKTLLENSLELNRNKFLYYQLVFENNIIPEIKSIQAHLISSFVNVSNQWSEVKNIELINDNALQFDTAGYYPIDSFKLNFSQKNTITDVTVYSRNSIKHNWHYAGSGNVYSILIDGSLNTKDEIKTRRTNHRYWKIVLDDHISNDSVKSIGYAWKNHQIEFLAQGNAPFSLLYGNKSQNRQAPNNWFYQLPKEIEFSDQVLISESDLPIIQKPQKQNPVVKSDKAKIIFWLILSFIVLLLGFMAYKLVGENNESGE